MGHLVLLGWHKQSHKMGIASCHLRSHMEWDRCAGVGQLLPVRQPSTPVQNARRGGSSSFALATSHFHFSCPLRSSEHPGVRQWQFWGG